MCHILFVTPYYPPEVGAPQTRISETATRLVQRGHRVTVLTTLPNYPSGVVPSEYRGGKRRRETVDGVDVVRVWSYIRPNKGFLNRVLAQFSFGCVSPLLGASAVGRPDVMIIESPPLFDAIGGRILARLKRSPFVFTVADLWPEAAIQMGLLRNQLAIWLAERLEWSTYRRARAIWTVTEGLHRVLVERGLPKTAVFTVSNGVDTTLFRPLPQHLAREQLGWDDHFTVIFAGTIGLAPGLSTLLEAAEQLYEYPDVRIVLLGDGAAKDELVAEAARRNLRNVVFLDPCPHDHLPVVLAAADVCFAGLRKVPLFHETMPVKCYEAMACARPILLAATSGLANRLCVDEASAALPVDPDDASAIAHGIIYLRNNRDVGQKMGERGRKYVQTHYDRDRLTTELEGHIAAFVGDASPIPQAVSSAPYRTPEGPSPL